MGIIIVIKDNTTQQFFQRFASRKVCADYD